jgi:hypothetical protein
VAEQMILLPLTVDDLIRQFRRVPDDVDGLRRFVVRHLRGGRDLANRRKCVFWPASSAGLKSDMNSYLTSCRGPVPLPRCP